MHRLAHAGTLALPGGVRRRATHRCAAWRCTAEIGFLLDWGKGKYSDPKLDRVASLAGGLRCCKDRIESDRAQRCQQQRGCNRNALCHHPVDGSPRAVDNQSVLVPAWPGTIALPGQRTPRPSSVPCMSQRSPCMWQRPGQRAPLHPEAQVQANVQANVQAKTRPGLVGLQTKMYRPPPHLHKDCTGQLHNQHEPRAPAPHLLGSPAMD